MKKAILLLLPLLVLTACSLDAPHVGELCPPEGKDALVYVFENGIPVERSIAQCPDELPVCTPFTDTSQLFGNYYCNVRCEGATVPCDGYCISYGKTCGEAAPLLGTGEACRNNEACESGICVRGRCMVAFQKKVQCYYAGENECYCDSITGCYEDGYAISCPDNCLNGCNLFSQICCPEICREGCDSAGNCLCPGNCQFGCDSEGVCIMNPDCTNGWVRDGSCVCPQECTYGCDGRGSCYEPMPCDESCTGNRYCNSDNLCVFVDANHNHMHDKYETAPKQGEYCISSENCSDNPDSSEEDSDDPNVFCDSFIGYRCSTKCTSDEQCVDDDEYHYVCRKDGRCAPDEFVTVWEIPANDKTLTLPKGANTCKFEIDWGDSNGYSEAIVCEQTETITHTYMLGGKYTVKIRGSYDGFAFANKFSLDMASRSNASKLIEIRSFGPVKLASYAFSYCTHLVSVSNVDIPDLSDLNHLDYFFFNATSFNDDIENWDVSNIETMTMTFAGAISFNQPLGWWDTSNVSYYYSILESALSFNQSLAMWDTSSAIDMSYMFRFAQRFNQPLNSWDVSSVLDMRRMFDGASNFNQPIEQWDVSNVETMEGMFAGAVRFNQPLNQWKTISVENMSGMFAYTQSFNQPLSDWDVSGVQNMVEMFNSAAFDQPLDMWHVSDKTNVSAMFDYSVYSDVNACGIMLSETWRCAKQDLGFKSSLTCKPPEDPKPEDPQPAP